MKNFVWLLIIGFVGFQSELLMSQDSSSTNSQEKNRVITITSAKLNLKHDDGEIASGDGWTVSKRTLRGGVQEGVEVISVDNGKTRFLVVPTRGMSVYQMQSAEMKLGWQSPVKQLVHPKFVDLQDHGGLGWLAGFNEFMCRCGISFAGAPGEDDGKMLTLHGRIGNIPASEVEVIIDQEAPHRIRVRGLVEERMFKFGVFELWTEVSTVPGSNSIRFEDRLINRSSYDQEYQMIYHTNFGKPFLEEGAKFVGAVNEIYPLDSYAAKDLPTYDTYLGPTPNFGEQVYCMKMHYDEKGMTTTLLKNKSAEKGVAIRYAVDTLPCFILWKNTEPVEDGYVTGLEPSTGYPFNRSIERENDRVLKIGPGLEKRFVVEIEMLTSADSIEEVEDEIAEIVRNREPIIHSSPPNGEQEPKYVTVQHILIGFEGSVPGKKIERSKSEAEELAASILERAQNGEPFDDLVKEFTDDAHPGIYQMANFGLEGDMSPEAVEEKIFPRAGMVGAFGNVGFPLKLNGIGMAVYDLETSKYGWHIIKRIK